MSFTWCHGAEYTNPLLMIQPCIPCTKPRPGSDPNFYLQVTKNPGEVISYIKELLQAHPKITNLCTKHVILLTTNKQIESNSITIY